MKVFIICAVLCAVNAGWIGPHYGQYGGYGLLGNLRPVVKVVTEAAPAPAPVDPVGPPAPYEMGYDIVDGDGNRHGRKESGDAAGNKAGSYSLALVDGRRRIVEYKADGEGFRAIVKSNEPGTDASQDPADVDRQPLPAAPAVVVKKVAVAAPAVTKKIIGLPGLGLGYRGYGGYGYGHGLYGGYGHGLYGGHGYGRGLYGGLGHKYLW